MPQGIVFILHNDPCSEPAAYMFSFPGRDYAFSSLWTSHNLGLFSHRLFTAHRQSVSPAKCVHVKLFCFSEYILEEVQSRPGTFLAVLAAWAGNDDLSMCGSATLLQTEVFSRHWHGLQ